LRRRPGRRLYAGLEERTARTDRVIETVRRVAPALVIGGFIAMIALGPRRIVSLVQRGLPIAFVVSQIRSALTGLHHIP
jgi:6-phosphogluconate dehydrogenase